MARLKTLEPRVQVVPGRQLANVEGERAGGWGSERGGRPWRRKRETILLRDKYTCQACGTVTSDLEVDHIINIARGGNDDDANLQALCAPCHKAKTAVEAALGSGW